jgi:hypothetical protein
MYSNTTYNGADRNSNTTEPTKKKRGRPPKSKAAESVEGVDEPPTACVSRGRGRPRKDDTSEQPPRKKRRLPSYRDDADSSPKHRQDKQPSIDLDEKAETDEGLFNASGEEDGTPARTGHETGEEDQGDTSPSGLLIPPMSSAIVHPAGLTPEQAKHLNPPKQVRLKSDK